MTIRKSDYKIYMLLEQRCTLFIFTWQVQMQYTIVALNLLHLQIIAVIQVFINVFTNEVLSVVCFIQRRL